MFKYDMLTFPSNYYSDDVGGGLKVSFINMKVQDGSLSSGSIISPIGKLNENFLFVGSN